MRVTVFMRPSADITTSRPWVYDNVTSVGYNNSFYSIYSKDEGKCIRIPIELIAEVREERK